MKKCMLRRGMAILLSVVMAVSLAGFSAGDAYAASEEDMEVSLKIGKKNVTKKTFRMAEGTNKKLKVVVKPASSVENISYQSNKRKVVTVSKTGKLKAKKEGTARVTVRIKGTSGDSWKTWVKIRVFQEQTPSPSAGTSVPGNIGTTGPESTSVTPANPEASKMPDDLATPAPTQMPDIRGNQLISLDVERDAVLLDGKDSLKLYLETEEVDAERVDLYTADDKEDIVCSMYDDGDVEEHGDEDADDGIYSACIPAVGDEDMSVTFVAKYGEEESNEVTVNYYTPISDESNNAMKEVEDGINALVSSDDFLDESYDKKVQEVEKLLHEFEEENLITENSIYHDKENQMISFQYPEGVQGGVTIEDSDEYFDENLREWFDRQEEEERFLEELNSHYSRMGKTAILLNSFPAFETSPSSIAFRTNFYQNLQSSWNASGGALTMTLKDNDVTVQDYTLLSPYDVICVSTHGNRYSWRSGLFWHKKNEVSAICLAEGQSQAKNKNYSLWLKDKQVVMVDGCYWILPSFFEKNYAEDDLEDSFVFLECCMSMGTGKGDVQSQYDTTMGDAFLSRGAQAYVGFHNSVFAVYSREFMQRYINNLLTNMTARAAFDDAIANLGANHKIWYEGLRGPGALQQLMVREKKTYDEKFDVAYPVFLGDPNAAF